jgi:hypothetical protein
LSLKLTLLKLARRDLFNLLGLKTTLLAGKKKNKNEIEFFFEMDRKNPHDPTSYLVLV